MNVLVTGASGFLGRAVAAELVAAGHSVRTLQRRPSGIAGATILGDGTVSLILDVAEALAGSKTHTTDKQSAA